MLPRLEAGSVARWIVLFLAALLPVWVVPNAFTTLPQAKMLLVCALVALGLGSWLWFAWKHAEVRIPKSALLIVSVALPIAYLVSAIAAGWTAVSFIGSGIEQDTVAAVTLWYASLALAALVLSRKQESAFHFLLAVVGAGGVVALYELARFAFPDASLLTLGGALAQLTANPVGSWYDLAVFLSVCVFAGLGLYTSGTDTSHKKKLFGAFVALAAFLVLLVSSFFLVWFSLGALCAAFALFAWYNGYRIGRTSEARVRIVVFAAAALFAFALALAHPFITAHMPERFQRFSELAVRPSWEGTFAVGQRVVENEGSLLFGTGPNSFGRDWARYRPSEVNATTFWDVGFNAGIGVVPTAFVTTGALGVLAWLVVAFALLHLAWRFFLDRHPLQGKHATLAFLLFGALFLVAHHLFYVPGVTLSALSFLFLGAVVAARSKDDAAHYTYALTVDSAWGVARVAAVVLLSVSVFLATLLISRSVVSHIFIGRAADIYAQTGDVASAQVSLARSLFFAPDNDRAHRAAVELGIVALRDLAQSGVSDDAAITRLQAQLASTVEHGLAAVSLDDKNYQNWLTLASLYQELAGAGVSGAYEASKEAYSKARAENPTNPLLPFRLAQLESATGNASQAYMHIGEALALKDDFAAAHYLHSQLLVADGKYGEAQEAAVKAAQFVPQDPLVWYNLGTILYTSGAFAESAQVLSRAVELQSDYSNAMFVLALAHAKLGRTEEALGILERVQALNPSDTGLVGVIERVRAGKDPFAGASAE